MRKKCIKRIGKTELFVMALVVFGLLFILAPNKVWANPLDLGRIDLSITDAISREGHLLFVNNEPFHRTPDGNPDDAVARINELLADGTDVTVRGGWSGISDYSVYLYIPEGRTLTWAADISGECEADDFFNLLASWDTEVGGVFVLDGGNIMYTGSKAAVYSADIDLIIKSGTISAIGDNCLALSHLFGNVTLKGGEISAAGDLCVAFYFWDSSGDVVVDGGAVTATGAGSYAVYIENSTVTGNSAYSFIRGKITGESNVSDNVGELLGIIAGWNSGGVGKLNAMANPMKDTVTITGYLTGVRQGINLRITPDVTVVWDASFSSAEDFGCKDEFCDEGDLGHNLVSLEGEGVFVVASGGSIVASGDGTNTIHTDGVAVVVRGTIKNTDGADYSNSVICGSGDVVLDGGTITATREGNYAINLRNNGTFSYTSGMVRGAISPHPGVDHDGFDIHYSLRQTDEEKYFSVTLPSSPVGISTEYAGTRVYPRNRNSGIPPVVDRATVNVSGSALAFSTLTDLISSNSEADVVEINAASRYYNDYSVRVFVEVTSLESLLPHQTPAASVGFVEEELFGLEPGAEYAVFVAPPEEAEGTSRNLRVPTVTANARGIIPINPVWFGETIHIVKKGDRRVHADSPAQILSIPRHPEAIGLFAVAGGNGILTG
ncbi:MAG: hypothetical protein FWD21_01815, partial [Peptococcaceae bacterium]|nr:hypothetical protein [Peptococcaceae bacterium]